MSSFEEMTYVKRVCIVTWYAKCCINAWPCNIENNRIIWYEINWTFYVMCLAFYWCWFPCHDNLERNKNDYSDYCLGKLWLVNNCLLINNNAKEIPKVYNTTNSAGCPEYSISVCKVQIKWGITYSPHKCSYNNLRKLFPTVFFFKNCLAPWIIFPI